MTESEPNTGLLPCYPYRALESRVLAALADAGFDVGPAAGGHRPLGVSRPPRRRSGTPQVRAALHLL
jgi:hypothetical protein